jgi:hypothetical protein
MRIEQLSKLKKILRIHANWLLVKLLGEEAVSKEEIAELKEYKKLPLDNIDFVEKSYLLGRLRSILKTSEYKKLNYAKLEEISNSSTFTSLEDLAVKEAKLHAAVYLKRLADDIVAGAFDKLSNATQEAVTESAIQGIIRDQTALALQQKQSYQKLASNLVKELKTDWRRNWQKVAATELHRAKTQGSVMAIINKHDVYSHSEGVESFVSVIPSPDTCSDCSHHYLDKTGNPKVFRLSDLLSQGSNGDSGVSHKRGNGRHVHWKTTLPPVHPSCNCYVVYVPSGMSWVDGKLEVTDQKVYTATLKKAVDTRSLKAVIKPPGPQATQKQSTAVKTAANPPSIKGAPAPGNVAGPGRPASSGPKIDWEYYKEEGQPPGDGDWSQSDAGAWRRPSGSGGKAGSPEQETAEKELKIKDAKEWGAKKHVDAVVLNHISDGKIVDMYELKQDEKGVNKSYRGTIEGNGRALFKLPIKYSTDTDKISAMTGDGVGTVPHGTHSLREKAAYHLFTGLGMNYCSPTTTRMIDGEEHSGQRWHEDKVVVHLHLADKLDTAPNMGPPSSSGKQRKNSSVALLKLAKNPESMKEKLSEIITSDVIMNSNDRHTGNIMVSEDYSDVVAIDHGTSFGTGMAGYKNVLHQELYNAGHKVKIPDKLQERLRNTSLGDFKRALGDHVEHWAVGQTFLRTQYALHLQETEGHLDYKHFTTDNFMGDGKLLGPFYAMQDNLSLSRQEAFTSFADRKSSRQLAHQKFEDFSIDFLDKASVDKTHPHHEAAKELLDTGVFMGGDFASGPQAYRFAGKHKEYEKTIRAEKSGLVGLKELRSRATVATKPLKTPDEDLPFARTQLAMTSKRTGSVNAASIERAKEELATAPVKGKQDQDEVATRKGLYIENLNSPFPS